MGDLIQHQESAPVVVSESTTILQVIQRAAADPQCDIEKMERLMAMHERMQAKSAQTEYNAALAAMQCDIPSIAERGAGHNKITYATLEDINDVIKPIMQRYGFAMSFKVEHAQGGISVTGILMHRAGHREETTMLLPSDTSGSKNAVQAVGSTISYGKRYGICAMLNISTGDDVDGQGLAANKEPAKQPITDSRLTKAIEKINAGEYTLDRLHASYALNNDQIGRVMAEVQS
jgi:hypothetical protein